MKQHLQMDWIDGILIALGFGSGIALSSFFPSLTELSSNISVVGVFLAPSIRRFMFGPPNLPEPREGGLWGLISILGLLIIFFSMPVFFLSAVAIQQSQEMMPDFRSEVMKQEAELNEQLKDINAMLNSVVVSADTPQEEIDRLIAEKKSQREKEEKEKREKRIQERTESFIKSKEERFDEGISTLYWGLGICLFGSLVLRLRYPFGFEQSNDQTVV